MNPEPTARAVIRGAFAFAAAVVLTFSLSAPTRAAPFEPTAVGTIPIHTMFTPNDPSYKYQWGLPMIKAPQAWDATLGARNVVVAVVDTGVWYTDTDIAANMWDNKDGTHGYDFISNTEYPMDQDTGTWHGTGVAGVIGAITNNGYGIAGVCQCAVMALRALSSSGTGSTYNVSLAIRWAADHGARIINLSLGTNATVSGPTDISRAIDYAWSKGALIVAAAGNEGASSLDYPASLPNVVAVGAVDSNGQRASFSDYGPGLSVMAPGVGIVTLAANNKLQFPQGLTGTSLAAPFVSGVAGLVLSLALKDNITLTNKDLWNVLIVSADFAGPATQYGHGIVDAFNAVSMLNVPFISVNSYPTAASPSSPFGVGWTVFGPSGLPVTDTHVVWGTDAGRLGNATAVQSGTTRENYSASGLEIPSSASTVYFQVVAVVNGTRITSPVYSVASSSIPNFLPVLFQFLLSNILILTLFILALVAVAALVQQRGARARRAAYRARAPPGQDGRSPLWPQSWGPAPPTTAMNSPTTRPGPAGDLRPPNPPADSSAPPQPAPAIPEKMRCPKCGTAVNAGNLFCFFCGHRLR